MGSGECRKGRGQPGKSKGKIKGQLWYHPFATLVPSLRKPVYPHWGSAHLLLWMTQIMPSEPSIPWLAGEAAGSSSSPTLPGKGSHPPLCLQCQTEEWPKKVKASQPCH